jgi:hypothetical protein
MWFRSLFDALLARSSRTPTRQEHPAPRVRQRPPSFRPQLEILEDRTVPSTLTVTSTADSGTGSLRAEIAAANSGDTIDFAPSLAGQTITLTGGELAINKSLDIEGPGANQLAISGGDRSRVFDITASNASVTLAGLTISNGLDFYTGGGILNVGTLAVNNSTLSGNSAVDGGGIKNLGTLTVNNSTLSGNSADYGGAIENGGTLTVTNSTISGNQAIGNPEYVTGNGTSGGVVGPSDGMGGGIYTVGGTLSINSSTIADNQAIGGSTALFVDYPDGSGIGGNGLGGGLYVVSSMVSINNSTFAGNQAVGGAGYTPGTGYGGGIFDPSGALQMHDTILAGNNADSGPDLSGGVTSLGYNLFGNTTGGSGYASSDLLNVNPDLGLLQNNGGPTQTMALLAGSPAIDAGDNAGAPAYDQRGPGFARIVNGVIDIGAFEVQNGSATQASSLAVAAFPSVTTAGNASSFTVTALNADGSTDTSYTGTVHFTSSDGQAVVPADYTFAAADAGVHTFSATLKTAGVQSLTATDTSGLTGSEGGITVKPAAASSLVLTGFPSSITAGTAGTFTVTARDPYGNTATGYTGTVHFSSSDAKASLPATYTFTTADAGVHTFSATLKMAGTQSLTATDTSGLTGTDASITVNPAAASKFVLTAPSSVNAGVPFSLTVAVEDAYGNVVLGYTGTIHFSSTDNRAKLPANYTFTAADKGVHTFSGLVLHKKGQQKITVTDTHNSSLTASVTEDVL